MLLVAVLFLSGAVYTVWREPDGPLRPSQYDLSGVAERFGGERERLVLDSPLRFLECWENGGEGLRGRLRYYASAGEAQRVLGFDSAEQSLMRLARTVGLPVSEWEELSGGERFLLVRSRNAGNSWLPRALAEAGARMEIAEVQTGFDVIRVTMPSDWKGKQR